MLGRSPAEAVNAFVETLQHVLSCLGSAKVVVSPGGREQQGKPHSWTLNGGEPMPLAVSGAFRAAMHYEILDQGSSVDARRRFRVSTLAYQYAVLERSGAEVIAAHWHPKGKSPVTYPHWHLGAAALSEAGVWLKRAHIPSPRVSLEVMIRTAIEAGGVEPQQRDWQDRLSRAEDQFQENRTWP